MGKKRKKREELKEKNNKMTHVSIGSDPSIVAVGTAIKLESVINIGPCTDRTSSSVLTSQFSKMSTSASVPSGYMTLVLFSTMR